MNQWDQMHSEALIFEREDWDRGSKVREAEYLTTSDT